MSLTKRNLFAILITVFLIVLLSYGHANAASANASLSGGGNYKKGDTVTLTLTYSGSTFGTAASEISYNTEYLQYVDCSAIAYGGSGKVTISMSSANSSTLSCTIRFKALKPGTANVSASTVELYNMSDQSLSVSTKTASVKITDPSTSASSNANLSYLRVSSGSLSPSFSANTTEYKVNVGNDVTTCTMSADTQDPNARLAVSGSANLSVGHNVRKITVTAQNGKTKTYTINIYRADGNSSDNDDPDDNDDNDNDDDNKRPEVLETTIGEKKYTIVESYDNKEVPHGFTMTTAKFGEYEIPVFTDKELRYTLALLKDSETGDEKWFFYDEEKDQFRNSTSLTAEEIIAYEKASASKDNASKDEEKKFGTDTILFVALGATAAVLLGAVIVLQVKIMRRKR